MYSIPESQPALVFRSAALGVLPRPQVGGADGHHGQHEAPADDEAAGCSSRGQLNWAGRRRTRAWAPSRPVAVPSCGTVLRRTS